MGIPQPLSTLMQVYERRPDLQETYPEAAHGDYARLIDWAAGASAQKWVDSDFPVLQPGADWYAAHFTNAAHPIPWSIFRETTEMASNPTANLLHIMEQGSELSEHLPTLHLLITAFSLQKVVELGVRTGNSTLTLLEGARAIGGRVFSVDVDPCPEACNRVAQAGLSDIWTFVQGDDLKIPESAIPKPIDLLFIDTSHLFEYTLAELRRFSRFIRPGGWIALHDYVSYLGVARAVREFISTLEPKPWFCSYMHQNGLALIQMSPRCSNPSVGQDRMAFSHTGLRVQPSGFRGLARHYWYWTRVHYREGGINAVLARIRRRLRRYLA